MCAEAVVLGLNLDDDAILRHLLLNEDDFLDAFNDEVAARVVRTLLGLAGELLVVHGREPTVRGSEHHRHVSKEDVTRDIDLVAFGVLHVNMDWR